MRIKIFIFLLFLFVFPLKIVKSQEEEEKDIRIIQQKLFMRDKRLEITPSFGLSLNENITTHFFTGASISFHFTDNISFGAQYHKYFGKMSALANELGEEFVVYPEKKLIQQYFGAHLSYVLIYGKFIAFENFIIHFDAFVKTGGGVIETSYRSYHPSGNLGFGTRIFFNDFITLNFEVVDYIYRENYKAKKLFVNNVTFITGISVFAPFKYEYKYVK